MTKRTPSWPCRLCGNLTRLDVCHRHETATPAMFWAKVDRSAGSDACWLWNAARGPHGHGRLSRSGRNLQAHRVAYETLVGPIPAGLTLDHLCLNPPCVNPAHLEPVTAAENSRRAARNPGGRATRTHCPKGHEYTEANTYRSRRGQRSCKACSDESSRLIHWNQRPRHNGRPQGTGSISLTKRGIWRGEIRLGSGRRKSVYGPTREAVEAKLAPYIRMRVPMPTKVLEVAP